MGLETIAQLLWEKLKAGATPFEVDAVLLAHVIMGRLSPEERHQVSARLAALRAGL